MADPLSITASAVALVAAALATARSLHDTVKRFMKHDKNLGKLNDELIEVIKMLTVLKQTCDADVSIATLLEGPVEKCNELCDEFEKSMKGFANKSKMKILDWGKMEFKRGDIRDFIEDLARYKSTIQVGLGVVNLNTSTITKDLLQKYNVLVESTMDDLKLHMQRIEEKMAQFGERNPVATSVDVDLSDEKAVTEQCLDICQEAIAHIKALSARISSIRLASTNSDNVQVFEAESQTMKTLIRNQENVLGTVNNLQNRLNTFLNTPGSDRDYERSQLQADIEISKQCLAVCNLGVQASRQKVHRIGEVIADGKSDQVVMTTWADLFEVQKAVSKNESMQLVGSLTAEDYRLTVEKRYGSRWAVPTEMTESSSAKDTKTKPSQPRDSLRHQAVGGAEAIEQSPTSAPLKKKPGANEIRKRHTDERS